MPRTISLPREEYQRLRDLAERYETIRRLVEADFFAPPPTRNVREIIRQLRDTGRYPEAFLKSVERGLRGSTYFSGSRRRSRA